MWNPSLYNQSKVLIQILYDDKLPYQFAQDLLTMQKPVFQIEMENRRALDFTLNGIFEINQNDKEKNDWEYLFTIFPIKGERPRLPSNLLLEMLAAYKDVPLLYQKQVLLIKRNHFPSTLFKFHWMESVNEFVQRSFPHCKEYGTDMKFNWKEQMDPLFLIPEDHVIFEKKHLFAVIPTIEGRVAGEFYRTLENLPRPSTTLKFIPYLPHDQAYTLGIEEAVGRQKEGYSHIITLDDDSTYPNPNMLRILIKKNEDIIGGTTFSRKMLAGNTFLLHLAAYSRKKMAEGVYSSSNVTLKMIDELAKKGVTKLNLQTGLCSMLIKIQAAEKLIGNNPHCISCYVFSEAPDNFGHYSNGADQSFYDNCVHEGLEPKLETTAWHGHLAYIDLLELYQNLIKKINQEAARFYF